MGDNVITGVKKTLLEQNIIFKCMRLFEESIEWKNEYHRDFWVIFHQETTQTIKKLLNLSLDIKFEKASNILKSRTKNTVALLQSDLDLFDEKIKNKKKSS